MRAIVGLGNPRPAHAATRHNLGFWVVERLLKARPWKVKLYSWGQVACRPEGLLLRPATYMNRSGDAVEALVARFALRPGELLVVLDDVDLPVGAVRLRPGGGPGTHNGLRSVLETLGTNELPRLRVGVGAPPPGTGIAEYVLHPPEPQEVPLLDQAADLAAELALVFVEAGPAAALDSYSQARLTL
ncbi:MAG: aminoacyl-tRNA hydrolase [Candidatus Bipolaricaulota bacterium]